jgi:hypothetical protein
MKIKVVKTNIKKALRYLESFRSICGQVDLSFVPLLLILLLSKYIPMGIRIKPRTSTMGKMMYMNKPI